MGSPEVILQNLWSCFGCPLQRLPQITPGETLQRRNAQRTVHAGKGRTRKANPLRWPLLGSAPWDGRSKNQLGWLFQRCRVHLFISTMDIGQLFFFRGWYHQYLGTVPFWRFKASKHLGLVVERSVFLQKHVVYKGKHVEGNLLMEKWCNQQPGSTITCMILRVSTAYMTTKNLTKFLWI